MKHPIILVCTILISTYSFAQKIFSIKKMQFKKYVYISGFKFELERKKYKKLKSLLDN